MQLQIPNRITAAEAARESSKLRLNNVDVGELTNFLELCYSEIRREVESRNRITYIYLTHYDGYVMREVLRILREDGYQAQLKESRPITLVISWPESP
jgi:hypothetical protein